MIKEKKFVPIFSINIPLNKYIREDYETELINNITRILKLLGNKNIEYDVRQNSDREVRLDFETNIESQKPLNSSLTKIIFSVTNTSMGRSVITNPIILARNNYFQWYKEFFKTGKIYDKKLKAQRNHLANIYDQANIADRVIDSLNRTYFNDDQFNIQMFKLGIEIYRIKDEIHNHINTKSIADNDIKILEKYAICESMDKTRNFNGR